MINSENNSTVKPDNLIGLVVWKYVKKVAEETPAHERLFFMLTDLEAKSLLEIIESVPEEIEGRSILLKIHTQAVNEFDVSHKFLTEESPTHFRHNDQADVILYAAPSAIIESVGAGLGTVSKINESKIVEQNDEWLEFLNETNEQKSYLWAVLKGLGDSKEYLNLQMWVDFVNMIREQGFVSPVDIRVKKALPALRIPQDGIKKLPKFNRADKWKEKDKLFKSAFTEAKNGPGNYASLLIPRRLERVDVNEIRKNVEDFPHEDDEKIIDQLNTITALLDDANNIQPNGWRPSQENFCKKVSWERVGARVFEGSRNTKSPKIGERTKEFIEGDYHDEVTEEDKEVLNNMLDNPPSPKETEIEFFNRWGERLATNISLFNAWQKRLFLKEKSGRDLLSAFFAGFESLVIEASDILGKLENPTIIVRVTKHNKATFWQGLDKETQKLFRFELSSMSGLFEDVVTWDIDAAFNVEAHRFEKKKDSKKIDLVLYLVDRSELKKHLKSNTIEASVPRVKTTWQPFSNVSAEPITLALVDDIADLATAAQEGKSVFRDLTFQAIHQGDSTKLLPVSLDNRNTFQDVCGNEKGKLFDPLKAPEQDLIAEIKNETNNLVKDDELTHQGAENLRNVFDNFEVKYKTMVMDLNASVKECFTSTSIIEQVEAFREMCQACRGIDNYKGKTLRSLISKLCVVATNDPHPIAIIPAWHPLRLAERREKITFLVDYVREVLSSPDAKKSNLRIAFEEKSQFWIQWVYPEVAYIKGEEIIASADLGGYSLMVPTHRDVKIREELLEKTARKAADCFVKGVDNYLIIHPHQASQLTAAIYESNTKSLPHEIAKQFSSKLDDRSDLRCELVISHPNLERMREIYEQQNLLLETERISETVRGFLSRLRVDVKPLQEVPSGNKPAIDLVLLHEVVSNKARLTWKEEKCPDTLFAETKSKPIPSLLRRMITPKTEDRVGVYITLPNTPRFVAEFNNLLYELSEGFLKEGFDGLLLREVSSDDTKIREIIETAHRLGEWVITYDSIVSKTLYERTGVKIISDESLPGSEGRIIISTCQEDEYLKRKIANELVDSCEFSQEEAMQATDGIIDEVLQISGKKILSAASVENATKEIIGFAVMKLHMERAIQAEFNSKPIWISLDDHRSWFIEKTGEIADAIAVYIKYNHGDIKIYLQVGEAKYVGREAKSETVKKAKKQLQYTTDWLKQYYIDNQDEVSFKGYCSRLAELLSNRDAITEQLEILVDRTIFFDKLRKGEVEFFLCGEGVVCLHDEHESLPMPINREEDREYIRCHEINTLSLMRYIQSLGSGDKAELFPIEGLEIIEWYSKDSSPFPEQIKSNGNSTDPDQPNGESTDDSTVVEISQLEENNSADSGQTKVEAADDPTVVEIIQPEDNNPKSTEEVDRNEFIPTGFYVLLNEFSSDETNTVNDENSRMWGEKIAIEMQRALSHFDMQAEFYDKKFELTPNGALIFFRGHHSLTVSKIKKRTSELLTTYGIDVSYLQPGRGFIGVFIKREVRLKVPLASTWLNADWSDREQGICTSLVLGMREDNGDLLYLNFAENYKNYNTHAPHTLIAGETGSGKGVLIQNLLLQMIAFNDPKHADLILIDPKQGVDFMWLEGAPQMKQPIITDIAEAEKILNELVIEMDKRYRLFANTTTANITEYNAKVEFEKRLSRIFLVHDELGSWMAESNEYKNVILSSVASLGMKARAAGIHLVLITQRADVDAVPGKLRDNCGNRLCLKVQNSQGSKMVLNKTGAETLLGKGHMACELGNENVPAGQEFFIVQVPFASNDQLQKLASVAKNYWQG